MDQMKTSLDHSQFQTGQLLKEMTTSDLQNRLKNQKTSTDPIEDEFEALAVNGELLVNTPVDSSVESKKSTTSTQKQNRRRNVKGKIRKIYFADKYELSEEVLGQGAHSSVVVAYQKGTTKQYAVKVIHKYDGYDRARVFKELDILHFLRGHPNIMELTDFFEEEQRFYLVFERMEGGPLLSHIEKKRCFTEREASEVTRDIANALCHAHSKGIAHRDLKPENILCQIKEKVVPVKICDFDLASGIPDTEENGRTPELFTPVGSAEYMAPEIVEAFVGDAPAYDKRCDLWSLGVIIFIMLSGKPPFTGSCGGNCDWEKGGTCRSCLSSLWNCIQDGLYRFPEEDWGKVSENAKDLIKHLLVKNASKRYTASEVLEHPWIDNAPNTPLQTPTVLRCNEVGLFTSETVACSRILAEQEEKDMAKRERNTSKGWSGVPGFGLSPPGNSKLAKRRAEHLKKKESLPLGENSDGCELKSDLTD